MRTLIIVFLTLFTVGCSARHASDRHLDEAYRHYEADNCERVMQSLSQAERRSKPRSQAQPEISLLRGQCLERQGLFVHADGRVHFGQRPPAGAEQIEVRPQVVERDDQTREREARSERFFDARRQEQQAAREQASQTRAAREQECQSLRSQLSQLQLGGRFFRNDAAGERVYYSDSELEAARQRLAARISQVCN